MNLHVMKRVSVIVCLCMVTFGMFAQQKVTLNSGCVIPLQAVEAVKAADVEEGQKVQFRVTRDITVDDVTVIPYGTEVYGVVTLAKRSSWWGTKGRLSIKISELIAPDGTSVPLTNGNITITGRNRTALSVVLVCIGVVPCCFICGSKAKLAEGYELTANVASNVRFRLK